MHKNKMALVKTWGYKRVFEWNSGIILHILLYQSPKGHYIAMNA